MTERNGCPGRRYDNMPQQNQSPVVTDAVATDRLKAITIIPKRADLGEISSMAGALQ